MARRKRTGISSSRRPAPSGDPYCAGVSDGAFHRKAEQNVSMKIGGYIQMLVQLVEVFLLLIDLLSQGFEPKESRVSSGSRDDRRFPVCGLGGGGLFNVLLHLLFVDVEVLLGGFAAGECISASAMHVSWGLGLLVMRTVMMSCIRIADRRSRPSRTERDRRERWERRTPGRNRRTGVHQYHLRTF